MGFARVVHYFWSWLREGKKVDENRVRRENAAEERAEEVADRDLEGIDAENRPERVRTLARARADEVSAYLDGMSLGWYQIAIIFFIGCVAGLLIEEIWMLITAGLTENRVGLVWGPFSPLYGFGSVFLTVVSFELRRHGAKGWQVFLVAAVIGGLLEQITGWSMIGRLAQGESASLTRKRSQVQILQRPPKHRGRRLVRLPLFDFAPNRLVRVHHFGLKDKTCWSIVAYSLVDICELAIQVGDDQLHADGCRDRPAVPRLCIR